MLRCVEGYVINADLWRTLGSSQGTLIWYFSLFQAEGKHEDISWFTKPVDNVLEISISVGKEGAVVTEQQFFNELLNYRCFVNKMPKLNGLLSMRKRKQIPSINSFFTSRNIMLKRMDIKEGVRTHPC